MPPITKYAKSGDVNIAYQVAGDGPFDVVLVPGWVSHVENAWEDPFFSKFLHRIKTFCRLIILDRRGTGLSDPVATPPTLEEKMDDVRAVMDAAGSDRAALFGLSEGGQMCMLFAATYPQRTSALVLYGTFARGTYAPDYPWGPKSSQVKTFLDLIERGWGTGVTAKYFIPTVAQDKSHVQSWGRFERLAVSPGEARILLQIAIESDVRHVLPAIRVPTLVLNRSGDRITPVGGARNLAENIPGAKYVEFPGVDHVPWIGDMNSILGEVEEFLTGARYEPEHERVLATVLFTDIVGSTEQAAKLGDRQWQNLLERHHSLIRKELARFRGQEIDTAGDGFFATFDGPARAIRCACTSRDALKDFDITIRAGLHTGECEIMGDKVSGIAVHIGARVMGQASPNQVLVSNTVKDLVTGSGLHFADHGVHTLKGVPGEWHLYAVEQ
jgi:pimeloyl-ACP methyl ester carboxylesterase/class 3 adenylate cyclase